MDKPRVPSEVKRSQFGGKEISAGVLHATCKGLSRRGERLVGFGHMGYPWRQGVGDRIQCRVDSLNVSRKASSCAPFKHAPQLTMKVASAAV